MGKILQTHSKKIAFESSQSIHFYAYRFLVNVIPIIRNEHSWPEYIIAALVTGALGGHLFSDPVALGFEDKKGYRTAHL